MNVYTANPNLVSTSYIRGLGLAAARTDKGITFYHYNAHGDVVQLTDANGNIIRDYTYDAFGVEQDADETDSNPFRYCGEQYDSETGNYYLRARYYTPGTGRFGQEDTHWNPGNMVYGDDPQKWNEYQSWVDESERDDPLGLHTYTYKPEATAVAQAGNLYGYALNNPLAYCDSSGEFVVSTVVLVVAAGAVVGGLVGNYVANKKGATGWKKAAYIAGGALGGGAVGYVAAPAVVSATGVAGVSVSAAGISTVATTSSLGLAEWVKNGNNLVSWAVENLEKTQKYLNKTQVQELFSLAKKYGVKITADLAGHPGTKWAMAHLHLGDGRRAHIAVSDDAINWISKQFH